MPCSSPARCPISRTNSRNGCDRNWRGCPKFPIRPQWRSGSPTNLAGPWPEPRNGACACPTRATTASMPSGAPPRAARASAASVRPISIPRPASKVTSRETLGGDFFYRFHFQFHYMPVVWGRWLAGAAAMFMLVAIVSGVITHKKIFVDFFTFRWGKGQRSWLDAHNALSVFGLPFHLMITYTGTGDVDGPVHALGRARGVQDAGRAPATLRRTQRLHPAGQAQRAEGAAGIGRGHGAAGPGTLGPGQCGARQCRSIPEMRQRAWR